MHATSAAITIQRAGRAMTAHITAVREARVAALCGEQRREYARMRRAMLEPAAAPEAAPLSPPPAAVAASPVPQGDDLEARLRTLHATVEAERAQLRALKEERAREDERARDEAALHALGVADDEAGAAPPALRSPAPAQSPAGGGGGSGGSVRRHRARMPGGTPNRASLEEFTRLERQLEYEDEEERAAEEAAEVEAAKAEEAAAEAAEAEAAAEAAAAAAEAEAAAAEAAVAGDADDENTEDERPSGGKAAVVVPLSAVTAAQANTPNTAAGSSARAVTPRDLFGAVADVASAPPPPRDVGSEEPFARFRARGGGGFAVVGGAGLGGGDTPSADATTASPRSSASGASWSQEKVTSILKYIEEAEASPPPAAPPPPAPRAPKPAPLSALRAARAKRPPSPAAAAPSAPSPSPSDPATADTSLRTPPVGGGDGKGAAGRAAALANTVYAGVKQKMGAMKSELQTLRDGNSKLQEELRRAEAGAAQAAEAAEAAGSRAVEAAKAESEEALGRHLEFIDRLLADKTSLSERCERLAEQVTAVEARYSAAETKREDDYKRELK